MPANTNSNFFIIPLLRDLRYLHKTD